MAIQLNEKDFFAELTATFKQNGLSSLLSKEKAEKLLASAKEDKELSLAKAKLMRAISRIGVAEEKR